MNKRRGKYLDWISETGLLKIGGWARDGLTDEQIAHNMGVSYSTFRLWRDKYPDIKEILKQNKLVVDLMVENALFKRALGYEVEEITEEDSEEHGWRKKTVKRHIPADTTAQIFWLKNRRPDRWRDKPVESQVEDYEDDGLIDAIKNSECALVDDMEMVDGEGTI